MKKEDKELLLQDLSMRLPYGVKCQAHNGTLICVNANNGIAVVQTDRGVRQVLIVNLKPYLRPMSSMTEVEKSEYKNFYPLSPRDLMPPHIALQMFCWLLKNHFDFCDLIPKGLALEAPKDMYNEIKEEKK